MLCKFGIVSILVFSSLAGWASEPTEPSERSEPIEQITVTAHRTPVTSVPEIEVITRKDIEHRQASVGPDILATLPGIAINRSGAFGGQAQIRVRGAEANHLQVLIDGIEVNDPAIGSEFDFAHLNLAGVERIEFLPGAHSALWGSDAVAGVLNFVTVPTTRRREIAASVGSFETMQARMEIADSLQHGYYSFAADHYDTDGTNHSLTGSEDDGYRNTTFHFTGGYSGETYGAKLVLRHTDSETQTDPAPFPISVPIDGDNRTDLKQTAALIEVNASLMDGRWLQALSVSYLETDNDNRVDQIVTDQVDGERLRISLREHFRFNEHHGLTAILEREEEQFKQRGTPSFFGDPNQNQDGSSNSIAIEHMGHWGSISTSISARFDSNDDFEDDLSYRLSARYRIAPHWETVVAAGTGVKNPSFFERFGFTPETFVGNPDLDPEENRHLSVGLNFDNGSTSLGLTYFNDELRDEINGFAPTQTLGIFTATNLTSDSSRSGIELQGRAQLGGFDFDAGYLYLDAEGPDDVVELRRPEHSGHVTISRGFANDKGYVQVGSIFTGEQIDTDFRTFTPVVLDNYSRVHVAASYEFAASFTLAARIENALDSDNEDVFMFRAPERAYFLTLEAHL